MLAATAQLQKVRRLVPVLAAVCRDLGASSERDGHRQIALDSLAQMYRMVMTVQGPMMSTTDAAAFLELVETFLLHYGWLTKYYFDRGKLKYSLTFKAHCLWHIAYFAKHQHPKMVWCYAFEHFIGLIIRAAKACQAGTPLWRVPAKVTQNYLLVLHMQLNKANL